MFEKHHRTGKYCIFTLNWTYVRAGRSLLEATSYAKILFPIFKCQSVTLITFDGKMFWEWFNKKVLDLKFESETITKNLILSICAQLSNWTRCLGIINIFLHFSSNKYFVINVLERVRAFSPIDVLITRPVLTNYHTINSCAPQN